MQVIERLETAAKQHCGCTELALGVIFLSAGMQPGDMLFFHQGLKMTGPLSVRSTGSGRTGATGSMEKTQVGAALAD
jgi:hypothetical protein